jgi:SAM-dependent methyltransferase
VTEPRDVKSCCARAYESDVVAAVLGPSYHPGGLALTRRLARALGLGPGMRVLDVAAGPGATGRLLAEEFGCEVVGVDLGGTGGGQPRVIGDAEQLPFADGVFDALVCECAFCTFPGKAAAAGEFARVLRPGGRLGMTDVTVSPGGLPPELAELAGWVACLADARTTDAYRALLAGAGLGTTLVERHDDALGRMVDQIDARLRVLRMTGADSGVDFDRALRLTRLAAEAAQRGTAGYALLIAERSG